MRYKIISIIYNPLKYIFTNIIYFIKLASVIITILSLLNISLFYYNFDIINEVSNYINKIINYIKILYNKWFTNDEDEINEPIDFLHYKKETKIITKVVEQTPNNSYWAIPLMIIGSTLLYYYNPHINLDEILEPIINKIEDKLPENFPTTFVTGTFIYKFITVSISYVTGYKFTDDDDSLNDEDRKNIRDILRSTTRTFSPTDELNENDRKEYESYFSKIDSEDINTPKASSSNLPNDSIKYPPYNKNPFKIITQSNNNDEIRIEDWE